MHDFTALEKYFVKTIVSIFSAAAVLNAMISHKNSLKIVAV